MTIDYDQDGHVVTITINRPEAHNSLDMDYKPIIAAVNGVCVAGGMEMLGSTDIRVATPDARFAVMEPKRGLFAGGGTTVRLLRQIAYPHAMELLLTARQRGPPHRPLFATEDAREGPQAFAEKRPPVWQGR